MVQDPQVYRRAGHTALLGLCVQIVLTVVVAVLGLWAQSPALHAATWHFLGGLPVWVVLWIIFKQHQIERIETLEVEQLSAANAQTAALFETQADDLRLARKRLDNLYKWGLGVVGLGLAVYLLALGLMLAILQYQAAATPASFVTNALNDRADANPGLLMAFLAGVAFVAFIIGRYAAGMTRETSWQLLRAGAGYLMAGVLLAGLLFIGALFSLLGNDRVMAWLGVAVPALMALLGLEIVLSFLAGAYRPRKAGERPRPAFDSRLMGWLTKPENLAKIVNETINYQFGFEVSRSWFYQLLSRSITPLLTTGLVVLILISSIVIVAPQQQALITTCGTISGAPAGPGLHLKWPWPIGRVQRYDVGELHEVVVGSYLKVLDNTPILWTNQHVEGKEEFLITAPTGVAPMADKSGVPASTVATANDAPAVSLIAAQMNVRYQIVDLLKYVQSLQDPQEVMTTVADRCLSQYFTANDIDTLLGRGRLAVGADLLPLLQARADALNLGVKVVYVGVTGVHPPQGGEEAEGGVQVAAAFHEQVGAIQEKETAIWKAKQERIQTLAQVAGSEDMAVRISRAVRELESLRTQVDAAKSESRPQDAAALEQKVVAQEAQIESLLVAAPGEAGQIIYAARAERWETGITEKSKAQEFPALEAAYHQAPNYFMQRAYLDALAQGLATPRKYIVASQVNAAMPTFRLDLKDSSSTLEGFLSPNR